MLAISRSTSSTPTTSPAPTTYTRPQPRPRQHLRPGHAQDLDHTRDLALALDLALDHTHTRDLDLALDLARNLTHDNALELALDLTHDNDNTRNLTHDIDVALAHGPFAELTERRRALGILPKCYKDLMPVLREGTRRSGASIAIREAVMGSGLASAFLAAAKVQHRKGQQRQHDELVAAFVGALMAPLGTDGNRTFTIDLDALAPALRDACERVRNSPGRTSWASYMAGQLRDAAKPIFTRRTPVTSDDATFTDSNALRPDGYPSSIELLGWMAGWAVASAAWGLHHEHVAGLDVD